MDRESVTSESKPRRRWPWILLAIFVVLGGLLFVGWRTALHKLETQVLEALGPEAQLRELRVEWPGVVVIEDLRLAAP